MKKLKTRPSRRPSRARSLRMEALEDRKMLTVTVDTLSDIIANDGLTSLREAIVTTNAAPFNNRIDFDASLSGGTIRLNSQLFVSDTLVIDASALAENIVINAQRNSRVFDFSATDDNFTLRAVTVKNGEIADAGGGIRFDSTGELTLINSQVVGNRTIGHNHPGGGIHSGIGDVTLIDSTVSDNRTDGNGSPGGGIRTHVGDINLTRSTISNNATEGHYSNGGGIYSRLGDITLTRTTVGENFTSGRDSDGAGVHIFSGTLTATNSTISGNIVSGIDSQGAGIHTEAGNVVINHSTVTDNSTRETQLSGAGISMDPDNLTLQETLTIHDSIVADNTVRSGVPSDFLAPAGPQSALIVTHSLIGDNVGTTLAEAQTADAHGNLIGSTTNPIDPKLGPLADNGGGTHTHSPLSGSPALDAGDPLMVNPAVNDQRGTGYSRVINGRIDMGAVERDRVVVNDNSTDTDDGLPDNGVTTLREAINLANAHENHTLITFDPALSGQTIPLTNVLTFAEDVTIDASALDSNVIVDGQGLSNILHTDPTFGDGDASLTIAGLTLTGGQTTLAGGAISFHSDGQLTITDSTISGNEAGGDGGGIFSRGNIVITRSTVADNTSHSRGGGIAAVYADLDFTDNTISGNHASLDGGGFIGIYAEGDISNSTISGNHAGRDGGGIHDNFLTNFKYNTITENTADGQGGGFRSENAGGLVTSSIVSGNDANNVPNNLSGTFVGGSYNLLGDGESIPSSTVITGINDPLLGPLTDNGGPTLTHALLPGSPAINMGRPLPFPEFDQRGAPFARESGLATDIGSFELQPASDPDFNDDGIIDGVDIDLLQANIVGGPTDPATFDLTGDGQVTIADRDAWLIQAGAANLSSGAAYQLGDANLDGAVDGQDFIAWNNAKFTSTSAWTEGDFNADGVVDGQDFFSWNDHKFTSADRGLIMPGSNDAWMRSENEDEISNRNMADVDHVLGLIWGGAQLVEPAS